MKLAIMQPYFFPYIGYFQLINAVDKIILYDHVHYIKKGWVHRNRILELNNGDIYIAVPTKNSSSNKRISEIEIDSSCKWQKKICDALLHNYRRSQFFGEIYPFLCELLDRPYGKLNKLNFETTTGIAKLLGVETAIVCGSEDYLLIEEDLCARTTELETKTQRIISICKQENAKTYVNAIGGTELYMKADFEDNGINLFFIKAKDCHYKQLSDTFYPNLSIIDVLFNCGVEKTKELLGNYELVSP